jgi:serine/threonine-protein kinase
MEILTSSFPNSAISPDGTRVVYAARREDGVEALFLQSADELEPRLIAGTEYGRGPFFAPDGLSLGFVGGSDDKLYRLSLTGGGPVPLADVQIFGGATWGPDDSILFTPTMNSGIRRVPAYGGEVEILTEPDVEGGERGHGWPQFLPGGREILMAAYVHDGPWQTYVYSLETGQKERVHQGGLSTRYVPTGHLVYVQDYTLMAVPFDLASQGITGAPIALEQGVRASVGWGKADFAISDNGTLVYIPGGEPMRMLERVDLAGEGVPLLDIPAHTATTSLSVDGTQVAMGRYNELGGLDIWVLDLTKGTGLSRLTAEPGVNNFPTWTPDGEWVTFMSNRSGDNDIWQIRADGVGDARQLIDTEAGTWPFSWSPDGKSLAVFQGGPDIGWDLLIFDPANPAKLEPYIVTNFEETLPVFSPGGQWIAYQSDRDGPWEVFVAPFPLVGRAIKVTAGGGHRPRWSPTGDEIFYRRDPEETLVVALEFEPELSVGQPRTLFKDTYSGFHGVFPDGQHLLMSRPAKDDPHEIRIVYNWFDELRRRVPMER